MACLAGAEKLVHDLHRCISEHWEDDDFVACKVDLRNAFNEPFSVHFYEMDNVSPCLVAEQGVWQEDPLGLLLFSHIP